MANSPGAEAELERIRQQVSELRHEFYSHLGAWQRAQIARHAQRPYTLDYIQMLFTDFMELHGDRAYGDDKAIIAGLAKFHGRPVAVIGHQKGRDTKQRVIRNFGQPKPEGYRKALRVMELAAKFGRPVITFIDTQGAYPGIDAEERGQAEAIAGNLREMARLPVPIICHRNGRRRLRRSAGDCGRRSRQYFGEQLLLGDFARKVARRSCGGMRRRPRRRRSRSKLLPRDLKELGIVDESSMSPRAAHILRPEDAGQDARRSAGPATAGAVERVDRRICSTRGMRNFARWASSSIWVTADRLVAARNREKSIGPVADSQLREYRSLLRFVNGLSLEACP